MNFLILGLLSFFLCSPSLCQASSKPTMTQNNKLTIAAKLTQWVMLIKSDDDSFSPANAKNFLLKNLNWPLLETIQKKGEAYYFNHPNTPVRDVLDWFSKLPPISTYGEIAYGKALIESGHVTEGKGHLERAWVDGSFSPSEEKKFLTTLGHHLDSLSYEKRTENLLLEKKITVISSDWPLSHEKRHLYEAILNIQNKSLSPQKIDHLNIHNQALILEKLRYYKNEKINDKAYALLTNQKQEIILEPNQALVWWKEINILVRRFLENGDPQKAYNILCTHQLEKGKEYADAEWLKGWILLEFLDKAEDASKIFEDLYEAVKTPISRSRVAFWLARSLEKMSMKDAAKEWYHQAAKYYGTYYGLLAALKLDEYSQFLLAESCLYDPVTQKTRHELESKELFQAIQLIHALNKKEYLQPFFTKLAMELTDASQQNALLEYALKMGDHSLVVETAKQISTQSMILNAKVYPQLPKSWFALTSTENIALMHALIRQESRFKKDAKSTAGAMGLSQLMPETAKMTAKKYKIKFTSLFHPETNVKIGSSHFKDLLEEFDGSIILSICAYNAGKNAVYNWIEEFGRPTSKNYLNWIEMIPYGETRNYVQRVLENYLIYRFHTGVGNHKFSHLIK